jgi:hypothetical protein
MSNQRATAHSKRRAPDTDTELSGMIQRSSTLEVPETVHETLGTEGQPLEDETRAFMEPRFGHDFSRVRIHTDDRAVKSAELVNALAYTVGSDIVFNTGQYTPSTHAGKHLLAHELTHVIQQQNIEGDGQIAVGAVDDNYEQEADAVSSIVNADTHTESSMTLSSTYSISPSPNSLLDSVTPTLTAPIIQRQAATQAPQMSLTPEYAQGLTDEQLSEQVDAVRTQSTSPDVDSSLLDTLHENLNILEAEVSRRTQEAQHDFTSARDQLLAQGPYTETNAPLFVTYSNAAQRLVPFGAPVAEEIQGIPIPGDQLLTVSDAAQVQLVPDMGIAEIGEDLFPALNAFAAASQGGELPIFGASSLQQVVLWDDGRAVIGPPDSTDLATLLIQGQPSEVESGYMITELGTPWERVRNASVQGVLTSGIYQFGTYPISSFNGVALPANYRIRFADPTHAFDSRLVTIFEKGTKRYYAWDAHAPVPGAATHDFYHINQDGMYSLFKESNHAPIPLNRLSAARGVRYLRIGGRVFLLIGVFVDAYQFGNSIEESVEQDTPRPAIAQAVRTIGGWGGAWAGAKLLCVGGGAATIETGPGAVLGCIAGGIVGGFAGYFAADWVADMIESN